MAEGLGVRTNASRYPVRVRFGLVSAFVFAPFAVAPLTAAQDSADEQIAHARELVLYAHYPEAIAVLESLLRRTDLNARQRNAALEVLATAQIADRRMQDARATLEQLYARDPDHRLSDPDASPTVVSAFARIREARPAPIVVELRHVPPGELSGREPPHIELQIGAGADAVDEVRLAYRLPGEPGFAQIVMSRRNGGFYVGRIPVVGRADRAIDIAYYLVAVAPSGAELARIGSAAEPLLIRVPADMLASQARAAVPHPSPPPPGHGLAEEPAFWVVLGLVVSAGIAAGIGIGIAVAPQGPEQGTLGSVVLTH
jgi:hypothetical protein